MLHFLRGDHIGTPRDWANRCLEIENCLLVADDEDVSIGSPYSSDFAYGTKNIRMCLLFVDALHSATMLFVFFST